MAVFEHMNLHVAIAGFCKPDFDNGSSFRFSTHCLAFYFCFIYKTRSKWVFSWQEHLAAGDGLLYEGIVHIAWTFRA